MTLEKARSYAVEHLRAASKSREFFPGGFHDIELQEKYGITLLKRNNYNNPVAPPFCSEISEDNAQRLVIDSSTSAEAWDMARSINFMNQHWKKELPEALKGFSFQLMIGSNPRPRASETYHHFRRNMILSCVIYEVILLFDLSERKACQRVRAAAAEAQFPAPSDLTALWRKSREKRDGFAPKTQEVRDQILANAKRRLDFYRGQEVLQAAS